MMEIYTALERELAAGRDCVLVTVIGREGSAPVGPGAQMLAGPSGRLAGTVGGGAGENQALALACRLCASGETAVHDFLLHPNDQEDIGGVCGGSIRVLLQPISHRDPAWARTTGQLLDLLRDDRPGVLRLSLTGGSPALTPGTDSWESTGAACAVEGDWVLLPVRSRPRAVIFGAGHCGMALAPILDSVGFRVTVFDDRPEYADPALFPAAEQVICGDYEDIAARLTVTEEDYAVVLTSGHAFDLAVQKQLLQRELAYVGVIGSRKKTALLRQKLADFGIPLERLDRVHAPIGTPIMASTPAEIAVSIAGEMILARAQRRAQRSGPKA